VVRFAFWLPTIKLNTPEAGTIWARKSNVGVKMYLSLKLGRLSDFSRQLGELTRNIRLDLDLSVHDLKNIISAWIYSMRRPFNPAARQKKKKEENINMR
jgi:hypothetical protein